MPREDTKTGVIVQFPAPQHGSACLVTIYGHDLGRRVALDGLSPTVVGRGETCDVVVDMDNVSRRHCEVQRAQNGAHVIVDLRSTNGTFVNNDEIQGPRELKNGDLIKVGGTIFKYLDGESVEGLFHEEIYKLTIFDGLTEIYNKRYFLEFLEREMSRCQRYGRTLSMMMMDIDHFKRVNDDFGHIAGDYVLREIAGVVRAKVRREECFARYGGEELALVMPEAELVKVRAFAEKIRATVEQHRFVFEGRDIPVTLSIGVAQMTDATHEPAAFIQAADERLYQAKHQGRNQVVA